jgi:hypothetical protein
MLVERRHDLERVQGSDSVKIKPVVSFIKCFLLQKTSCRTISFIQMELLMLPGIMWVQIDIKHMLLKIINVCYFSDIFF